MSPQWYCLKAQTKREHIAADHVRQIAGIEVFLPRIRFQRKTARGPVWFVEALFPGYLFARFDFETQFRQVHHAHGVRGVVAQRYQYDSSGRLTNQVDALGRSASHTYDTANRRQTMTDRLNNVTIQTFTCCELF